MSQNKLRVHIERAIIEEINRYELMLQEPERFLPIFVERVTDRLVEIVQDETRNR